MKFYADENFPIDVVNRLRELGNDVLTAFEDGRANQKIADEKVLERAIELGRAVLTINRIDFKRLHKTNPNHMGIVICTFDADFAGQAERIASSCKDLPGIYGQLVRIYRPSYFFKIISDETSNCQRSFNRPRRARKYRNECFNRRRKSFRLVKTRRICAGRRGNF